MYQVRPTHNVRPSARRKLPETIDLSLGLECQSSNLTEARVTAHVCPAHLSRICRTEKWLISRIVVGQTQAKPCNDIYGVQYNLLLHLGPANSSKSLLLLDG